MEGGFSKELYSESLQLSKLDLDPGELLDVVDDGSLWGGSDDDKGTDLDREWQRRHNQFHTIGYREGLLAGKEESAQEGFNMGFKESFHGGYNWGLVRGVTSALICLPNELREVLVETQENRNKLQSLHESAHSLSLANNALKLFHDDLLKKEAEHGECGEARSTATGSSSRLGKHFGELQSILLETPAIKVHLQVQK